MHSMPPGTLVCTSIDPQRSKYYEKGKDYLDPGLAGFRYYLRLDYVRIKQGIKYTAMIKFVFQLKDKKVEAIVPESWQEMTVRQAIALNLRTWNGEVLEGIARLAGIERSELSRLAIKSRWKNKLRKATAFLNFPPPDLKGPIDYSKPVRILGKDIKIPEDLGEESFGQYAMFESLANRKDGIAMLTALYLQPLFAGKLGEIPELEVFAKKIEGLKFIQIMPIVNLFFLMWREYQIYGIIGLKEFLKRRTNVSRRQQVKK